MARLSIPKSEFGVLRDLAGLSDESFAEFLRGLAEIEPTINQLDFSGPLAKKVPSVDPDELKAFLRTLFRLYRIIDGKERTAESVPDEIKQIIEREKPEGFPMPKTGALSERLRKLLSIGGLVAVAAKAMNLALEQDRIFCGARILSDIRAVFSESPDSVSAAVVMHSLNISFHQDGQHKDFFIALTTNELATLKQVLERAEKKSESLKTIVRKAGVKLLNAGE